MVLKVGSRLRADVSACEVIVVAGTDGDDALLCAGAEMVPATGPADPATQTATGEDVVLGRRYTDEEAGIEVLCTKAGVGPLTFAGRELTQKTAKQLPASD
jgi:hypothetical protein